MALALIKLVVIVVGVVSVHMCIVISLCYLTVNISYFFTHSIAESSILTKMSTKTYLSSFSQPDFQDPG